MALPGYYISTRAQLLLLLSNSERLSLHLFGFRIPGRESNPRQGRRADKTMNHRHVSQSSDVPTMTQNCGLFFCSEGEPHPNLRSRDDNALYQTLSTKSVNHLHCFPYCGAYDQEVDEHHLNIIDDR
ncbi:hypothetical protein M8J77_021671 [Diaphorina citri]|nr:hypothetical protein M8J77_021671 [Diaphorina citri]